MKLPARWSASPDVPWRLAIAIALAIGLWVYATNQENPEASASHANVPIEIRSLANDLVVSGDLGTVSLQFSAPKANIDRLDSGGGLRAYVDLSGLSAGSHQIEIRVDSVLPVSSYSVQPEKMNIRLEKKSEVSLPIEARITEAPPFGYETGAPRVTPVEVTISGPESLVNQVSKAVVAVTASGQQAAFTVRATPQLLDAAGAEVKGLRTTPEDAEVFVPVELQVGYKVVPVKVNLRGEPAAGYLVSAVTVDPSSVTIIGDPSIVATTDFVETEPIDIAGLTTNLSQDVKPVTPQGVSVYKQGTLKTSVAISPIQTRMVVTLVPALVGLPEDMVASATPNRVDVTLSGSLSALSKLDLSQVKAVVNLTGLDEGVHQVAIGVSTPPGLTASVVTPNELTVTVIKK